MPVLVFVGVLLGPESTEALVQREAGDGLLLFVNAGLVFFSFGILGMAAGFPGGLDAFPVEFREVCFAEIFNTVRVTVYRTMAGQVKPCLKVGPCVGSG